MSSTLFSLCVLLLISFCCGHPLVVDTEDESDFYGDHSGEYHPITDAASIEAALTAWEEENKEFKKKQIAKRSEDEEEDDEEDDGLPSEKEVEEFLKGHEEAFRQAATAMLEYGKDKGVTVTARIKTIQSTLGKLKKKRKNKNTPNYGLQTMGDAIGMRLICETVDVCLSTATAINEEMTDTFKVTQTQYYGMKGDQKKKENRWKADGHRGIALDLVILKGGNDDGEKKAELQISTPYSLKWDDWQHDIFYKGATEVKENKEAGDYVMAVAKYLWKLDEARRDIPHCPDAFASKTPKQLLSHNPPEQAESFVKKYKKNIGSPNGCLRWNDMGESVDLENVKMPWEKKKEAGRRL